MEKDQNIYGLSNVLTKLLISLGFQIKSSAIQKNVDSGQLVLQTVVVETKASWKTVPNIFWSKIELCCSSRFYHSLIYSTKCRNTHVVKKHRRSWKTWPNAVKQFHVLPRQFNTTILTYVMLQSWRHERSSSQLPHVVGLSQQIGSYIAVGLLPFPPPTPITRFGKSFTHQQSRSLMFCTGWGKDVVLCIGQFVGT